MNTFTVQVRDMQQMQTFESVQSFIGHDATGSFSIWANHGRFITALEFGLASFRQQDSSWRYLSMPGGILYFNQNLLTINTRRYFLDDDYARINQILEQTLQEEEQRMAHLRENLRRLEENALIRLREIGQKGISSSQS